MSCSSGPNTVTSGLVFEYDMTNVKKSWKGKPTTNVLNVSGYDASVERSGNSYPFTSQNITTYVLANWSASNNKLSMSFEGKRDYVGGGSGGGNDGYPVMYIYFSDWSWSSSFGITSYDWSYNKIENITMPDPTGKTIYCDVYHMNSGNRGKSYSRNQQIEFNTFSTPFINGTRSNTQSLLDLTGNNTITANSLTYNSDGTFGFNGSNYTSIGNMGSGYNNFTVEVWFKPNSVSSYQNLIDCSFGTGNVGPRLEMNSSGTLGWVTGSSMNNYQGTQVVASGLTQGAIHCAVITKSGSTNTAYYQGNYVSNNTETYAHPGTFSNVIIGKGFSDSSERWFNGIIYSIKIYNRALTPNEVKQNFNTLRGRYGI